MPNSRRRSSRWASTPERVGEFVRSRSSHHDCGGGYEKLNGPVLRWSTLAWAAPRFRGDCKADGGAEGNRTPDLLIANEALYQLSYSPALQAARICRARRRLKSSDGRATLERYSCQRQGGAVRVRRRSRGKAAWSPCYRSFRTTTTSSRKSSGCILVGRHPGRCDEQPGRVRRAWTPATGLVWTVTDFLYRMTRTLHCAAFAGTCRASAASISVRWFCCSGSP